jgi:protein required for attachment to host cells
MRSPKVLFVVADGGRARFVRRAPGTSHFATFEELDDGGALRRAQAKGRGAPRLLAFQSATAQRHSIGRGEEDRAAKMAFARKVASRATRVAQEYGYDRIVVAAPPRLAAVLREQLGGNAVVAAALTRDLTKAPDASLGRWFLSLPGASAPVQTRGPGA